MNDPTAPPPVSHPLRPRRITPQLLTFFAAAFLIAWAAWIPLFWKPSLPRKIAFIGLFAPAGAALLTAAFCEGTRAVCAILGRLAVVGFPLYWALISALMMPAIYVMTIGVLKILGLGGAGPLFSGSSPLFIVAAFVWLLLVNSGEEIGWRGYALPILLERVDHPILVSLGFGLIWGVWHLPMYLLPGQSAFPLPLFLLFTSLQSVLYTVVFLRANGSVLPAILLHAGTDIAPRVFQLSHLWWGFWLTVDSILAVVVLAFSLQLRGKTRSILQSRTEIATEKSQ